jgi:hypothetical protein
MSTGGDRSKQSRTPDMDPSGGNSVGPTLKAPRLHQPPNFMDRSGQPDNQSTSRPKGST